MGSFCFRWVVIIDLEKSKGAFDWEEWGGLAIFQHKTEIACEPKAVASTDAINHSALSNDAASLQRGEGWQFNVGETVYENSARLILADSHAFGSVDQQRAPIRGSPVSVL